MKATHTPFSFFQLQFPSPSGQPVSDLPLARAAGAVAAAEATTVCAVAGAAAGAAAVAA